MRPSTVLLRSSSALVAGLGATLLLGAAGCAVEPSSAGGEEAAASSSELTTRAGRAFTQVPIDDELRARGAAPVTVPRPATTRANSVRRLMTSVKDQGPRDTCTSFSSAALIERYTGGDISEQCEVRDSGGEGGQIFYRVKDYLTKGVVDERLCTYDGGDGTKHVPNKFTYPQLVARSSFHLTDLEEVGTTPATDSVITFLRDQIDGGNPVGAGFLVIDGALTGTDTNGSINPKCNNVPYSTTTACPGHAIVFTGYDDAAQMLEFKNSWGTGWGNAGYGRLSYAYFLRYRTGPLVTLRAHAARANEAAIVGVYRDTFGRDPQSWEVDAWVTNLASNGWTIAKMRAAFAQNAQMDDAIRAVYQDVFGRDPAQWEVNVWKTNVQTGAWTIPTMHQAFLGNAQHTDGIVAVYKDVFDRVPAAWEVSAWQTNLSGTAWTLLTMRVAFADNAQTRTAIDAVYRQVLSRPATAAELDQNQLLIRDFGWTIESVRESLQNPIGPIQ